MAAGAGGRDAGARHFDKVMFNLPIPRFDEKQKLHCDLAAAAKGAEDIATATALPDNVKFQHARKLVRDALAEAGISHASTPSSRVCWIMPREHSSIGSSPAKRRRGTARSAVEGARRKFPLRLAFASARLATSPVNGRGTRARKLIRDALAEAKVSQKIDTLVARLLDK